MHVNRGLLGWGVFFIVLGAVPLAVQAGALDPEVVRRAWELWPLILIGIGLGPGAGADAPGDPRHPRGGRHLRADGRSAHRHRRRLGGRVHVVRVRGRAGRRGVPDPDRRLRRRCRGAPRDELRRGDARSRRTAPAGPSRARRTAAGLRTIGGAGDQLVVRAPGRSGVDLAADPWRWQVTLPRAVPVAMDLSVNAGSGALDLAGMTRPVARRLGQRRRRADGPLERRWHGAVRRLGERRLARPRCSRHRPAPCGAASRSTRAPPDLCVPDGVALRFQSGDQPLGSTNFDDRGLRRSGDTWSTPGYDAATSRIELDVSVNLGSITLDPEDGCD